MRGLNGWQRLWVVFATLLFVAVALLEASKWPKTDPQVLRDLTDPTCKIWVTLPPGETPDQVVGSPTPCPALFEVLVRGNPDIRSASDYRQYQWSKRRGRVLFGLGLWIAIVGGAYLAGWSVSWVRRGFASAA